MTFYNNSTDFVLHLSSGIYTTRQPLEKEEDETIPRRL